MSVPPRISKVPIQLFTFSYVWTTNSHLESRFNLVLHVLFPQTRIPLLFYLLFDSNLFFLIKLERVSNTRIVNRAYICTIKKVHYNNYYCIVHIQFYPTVVILLPSTKVYSHPRYWVIMLINIRVPYICAIIYILPYT